MDMGEVDAIIGALDQFKDSVTRELNHLREDMHGFGDNLTRTGIEIASIKTDLRHFTADQAGMKKDMHQLRLTQNECLAKAEFPSLKERLGRLETADDSKVVDISAHQGKGVLTKELPRWIPWLVMAALAGAGIVGFFFATGNLPGVNQ